MSVASKALALMFDRPSEPLFYPRGSDVFEMPTSFLKKKYQSIISKLSKNYESDSKNLINIKNITLPDLSIEMTLKKDENFSLFIPTHRVLAGSLIDILMGARTIDDFVSLSAYCHDVLNPFLFNYALSVAMLHRPDTKGMKIPSVAQTFPAKFLDSSVFVRARKEASLLPKEFRSLIVIDKYYTASDLEPEQRVAYFREDIGINLHHWHWHLVYPFGLTDKEIVNKDRRGELFFYMHHQILARYNAERLCNNLSRVKSLSNLREPIAEGYFSKLQLQVTSRSWPPRFMNTSLKDIDRPNDHVSLTIQDIEQWTANIKAAIDDGYLMDVNGETISIMNNQGIDVLGNTIEATTLSPNKVLYGDLHNLGHLLISLCHDPNNRFLEAYSVMGDTATAMRDPVFYRWHTNINELFLYHKEKLQPYTPEELIFKNVSITQVHVEVENNIPNQLCTYWEQSDVDLSRGLDFSPRGPVYVRFTHLQHEPFTYTIKVLNNSSADQLGTIRIFLAPMFNENGSKMTFNDQRLMMIEMDRFKVTLDQGVTEIVRKSSDSSVTIPYEKTFRNLNENTEDSGKFNFCGCGWPNHMLIPKGTEDGGTLYELFVMVSDYRNDKVVQDLAGSQNTDADSFCGIQDKKYPDKQPMGFPFDRVARSDVTNLNNFLTPNMKILPITISFYETRDKLMKKEDKNYRVLKQEK